MDKKMLTIIVAAVVVVAAVGIGVWALTQNNGAKTYNLAETTDDLVGVDAFNSNNVFESDDKTFKWTFDKNKGDGVPEGTDAIDLTVEGSTITPVGVAPVIPDGASAFFLSFDYDGTLPYEADLEYNLGKEFANKTMSFYELKDSKLVGEQQVVKVDGNGIAKVRMTHCSDWTLIESFEVIVEESKGVTFSLEEKTTVLYGEDISFTAEAQAGFDGDALVVLVNGEAIEPVNGKYKVSVNEPLKISAEVREKDLPKYNVSGTVADDGGKAVEGAVVNIGGLKDTTDKDGKYSIDNVSQGTKLATLEATCDGYVITAEAGPASVDKDTVVDFVAVKNATEYSIDYLAVGIPDGLTVKINGKDPSSKISSSSSSNVLVISGATFVKSADVESAATFSIGDQEYLLSIVISNGSDVKYEFGKEAKATFTANKEGSLIQVAVTTEGSSDPIGEYTYTPVVGDFIKYNITSSVMGYTINGTLTMRVSSIDQETGSYTVDYTYDGDYGGEIEDSSASFSSDDLFVPLDLNYSGIASSGTEKVGGVDCDKYVVEQIGVEMVIWVGQDDGIMYKTVVDTDMSQEGMSMKSTVTTELVSKNLSGLKKV